MSKESTITLTILSELLIASILIIALISLKSDNKQLRSQIEVLEDVDKTDAILQKDSSGMFADTVKYIPSLSISATVYYPDTSQTDASPYITADNSRISKKHPFMHRWIGLSPDLFSRFSYGDTVAISGTWVYDGKWIVHDIMHSRWINKIDFLIDSGMYEGMWDSVVIEKYEK